MNHELLAIENENDELSEQVQILASALRDIYQFAGEDPQISEIVNDALEEARV